MIRKLFLAAFFLGLASSIFSQQKEGFSPVLMPPKGHTEAVFSAQLDKGEKYVLTTSGDQTAKVWDRHSGKLLMELSGHKSYIADACFSPDMEKLVTVSYDKTARIWDFNTGKLLHLLEGHTKNINSCHFRPDGKQLMTHSRNELNFWEPNSGELINSFNGHDSFLIYSARYSSDGKRIISSSNDNTVKVWDASTFQLLLDIKGHSKKVWFTKTSPDERLLLSASDSLVKIWELQTGSLVKDIPVGAGRIYAADFSNDNSKLMLTRDSIGRVVDINSGKQLFALEGHGSWVTSIEQSPDSKYILTGSGDGLAKVWDSNTGELRFEIPNQGSHVWIASYSPSGKYFITATSRGQSAKLWDAETGALLYDLRGKNYSIMSAYFTKDKKRLMHSFGDGSGKVYDLRTGRLLRRYGMHDNEVYTVIHSPDNEKVLTTSGDGTIKIWDASTSELIRTLRGHQQGIFAGRFSRDNKWILSRCGNQEVKVWDVESGKVILDLNKEKGSFTSAEYDSTGNYILTACADSTAKLWDIKTGKVLKEFIGHTSRVVTAFFSPDSKWILTSSHDKTAKLWDAESGKELLTFSGHEKRLNRALFSKDGALIATVSRDNTVKVWDANTGQLLSTLEGHTRTIFTARFANNNTRIITRSFDNTAKVWETKTGKLLFDLVGHSSYVTSSRLTPDERYLMTSGADGLIIFWDWNTGNRELTLYPLADDNWVVVHKSGLFDASPNAMKWMYYLIGKEVIELDQLKERYYEPGLYEKFFAGESLRDVEAFQTIAMYPGVESEIEKDKLNIKLTERNGGVGKLSVFINNKEVISDVNPDRKTELTVNLQQFDRYFLADTTNTVSLLVFNSDGWLRSSKIKHNYYPGYTKTHGFAAEDERIEGGRYAPELYALIIGTSNYAGDQLDLKYADKDSRDIANAVKQSASVLFGTQKVHLKWFTSGSLDDSKPGSKKNVKAAIDSFAVHARAEDILLVYFSGHGVTYGESFEKQQFYYLTKDVNSGDLSDPQIRSSYAISSQEMTDWINSVPAQKQVMILDACSSGKVVEDLIAVRNIPASQVRALDRMKDRTGMFVLAGSAADKVSYEASQYGQGLLTYSLLLGMSGAALRDGQTVDVMNLFQFARDQVPEFAKDVGGVQTPTLAFPTDASSFDIGLVTESVQIPVQKVKPVFIRSNLFENESWDDLLGLSEHLDTYLTNISSGPQSLGIIFLDVNAYQGAYSIKGQYLLEGEDVRLKGRLFQGKERLGDFRVSGSKGDLDGLVDLILEQVMEIMN